MDTPATAQLKIGRVAALVLNEVLFWRLYGDQQKCFRQKKLEMFGD